MYFASAILISMIAVIIEVKGVAMNILCKKIVESWQYGLWSFQAGGTKLERYLQENQHKYPKEIIEF